MHSLACQPFVLQPRVHKTTSDSIETLRNLIYLIRLDAAEPSSVLGYVEHAETVLDQMQRLVSGEYPC
jgi:hypothetical protein